MGSLNSGGPSEQGKSDGESGSVALWLSGIKKTYGPVGP